MDSGFSKLNNLLSYIDLTKEFGFPDAVKLVSVNIDIGSINLDYNLNSYEYINKIIKQTDSIVFVESIICDKENNSIHITSIWSLNNDFH